MNKIIDIFIGKNIKYNSKIYHIILISSVDDKINSLWDSKQIILLTILFSILMYYYLYVIFYNIILSKPPKYIIYW